MSDKCINYAELFEDYWDESGRSSVAYNRKRTHDNLYRVLDGCTSIYYIDEYVKSLRSSKESTRKIMVDFLHFIEDKKKIEIDSELYDLHFYDDPVERQLEIAKFLTEPRKAEEIEKKFGINSETRKTDLRALRNGIEVLGSVVKLQEERIGRAVYYKSTVHPIFLPLNLTEVYALVEYLPGQLSPEDPNSKVIKDITKRIKAQLSDYAWEKIYPDKQKKRSDNYYISDQALAESREGIRLYLMKSGKECSFFWNGDVYRGRIDNKNQIRLTDNTILEADINEVDFIIDSLEYE